SFQEFPTYDEFDCGILPPGYVIKDARRLKISGYQQIKPAGDIQTIKGFIINETPVIAVISVDSGFRKLTDAVYHWVGPELGLHTVVVVGYDDNFATGGPSGRGAAKILNSYGPGFGLGGVAWIPYADLSTIVRETWVVSDA